MKDSVLMIMMTLLMPNFSTLKHYQTVDSHLFFIVKFDVIVCCINFVTDTCDSLIHIY